MKNTKFIFIVISILFCSKIVFGQLVEKSLTIVLPDKIDYNLNESFDKTGLKVIVNYEDGESKEVTDYLMTGFNSTTSTSNQVRYVTITYNNLAARFRYFVGQNFSKFVRRINLDKDMYNPDIILPRSIDLSDYLPPVKCQWYPYDNEGNAIKEGYDGYANTCLAWAFGYYCRTYLRAKTLNLTKEDLEKPENQFSPKYLHIKTYPYTDLYDGRNGLNAMSTLFTKGIATMATVPYNDFSDIKLDDECDKEAAHYKITSYDQVVTGFTVNGIKSALSKGNLIAFGANVGEKFRKMTANHVFIVDNFNNTTRHVMVICGYDDNRGENGAFKVVNTRGPEWCDNGFVWIDYDFFVRNYAISDLENNALGFCHYYAYIMYADDIIVESLDIVQNKSQYYLGDSFDKNDIVVMATYSDGSVETINNYELIGFETESIGDKILTVSYEGKIVSAKINVDYKKHTIVYLIDNQEYKVIENVVFGSKIIFIDNPSKNGYDFNGWECDYTTMPDKDIQIVGTYSVIKYPITFVSDGVVLQQSEMAYGEIPIFNGEIPSRESTSEYNYDFRGWDSEIVAVNGEKTYTAEFNESLKTGVNELSRVSNVEIWSYGKTIYVVNAKSIIQIFDINGRVLADVKPNNSRTEILFNRESGVYIVRTYGATKMVFIK